MSARAHDFGDHNHKGGQRKVKGRRRFIRRAVAKLLKQTVQQGKRK